MNNEEIKNKLFNYCDQFDGKLEKTRAIVQLVADADSTNRNRDQWALILASEYLTAMLEGIQCTIDLVRQIEA